MKPARTFSLFLVMWRRRNVPAELRLIGIPPDGLYRVECERGLDAFPPPPRSALGYAREGVFHSYRWEDILGEFATLKLSHSRVAAIGRAIAGFRVPRDEAGKALVSRIDAFMTALPDDSVPLLANTIPPSFFEDRFVQRLPSRPDVRFVDLADEGTLRTIERAARAPLRALGVKRLDVDSVRARNRRVTAAIVRALYDLCDDERWAHVAGLRYPGLTESPWDAYVMWSRPHGLPLALDDPAVEVEPLLPDDPDLLAACAELELDPPDVTLA